VGLSDQLSTEATISVHEEANPTVFRLESKPGGKGVSNTQGRYRLFMNSEEALDLPFGSER
jgi:hypothetical protein